jgi:hypothetical protein
MVWHDFLRQRHGSFTKRFVDAATQITLGRLKPVESAAQNPFDPRKGKEKDNQCSSFLYVNQALCATVRCVKIARRTSAQ